MLSSMPRSYVGNPVALSSSAHSLTCHLITDELQRIKDYAMMQAMAFKLYSTEAWKKKRAAQLRAEPLCRMCKRLGITTLATVADHIEPHRGNATKFWRGELQSLCVNHHSMAKQREEGLGHSIEVGADGWPTDPNHPIHQRAEKMNTSPP